MDTLKQKDFGFTTDCLRVRCPHCNKLYLVQRADIHETRPRFECLQCRERFWFSVEGLDAGAEVVGLPVQSREVSTRPQRVEPCPKCRAPIAVGSLECTGCGVVVSKWRSARSMKAGQVAASEMLLRSWQKVMDNFGSPAAHADFLVAARRDDNLPFAAQQYGGLSAVLPGDALIEGKLREIEALSLAAVPVARESRFARFRMPKVWQVPLVVGSAMMLMGLTLPMFRNLVGVGAALIFLGLALRWQFRSR